MVAIKVDKLKKYFTVAQKEAGILGTFKGIFSPKSKIVRAVDNVSFEIKEGELVGFIGPNGAGKTTTLKILSGVLHPDGGLVEVLGHSPWRREDSFLKNIALIMGQKNQLLWELPAIDSFLLNRAIYEIPKNVFNAKLEELLSLLDVKDLISTPVRKLSLGQRMRLELVAALLHNPRILFLDEPTIGLDVVGSQKIREFIAKHNKQYGSTILLTSHYMEDIERLATRVIIINQGKILFEGKLSKIIEKYAPYKVIKLLFSKEPNFQKLGAVGTIDSYEFPRAEIHVPRNVAPLAASQLLQSFSIADLTIEEPPVEEVIRGIYENL